MHNTLIRFRSFRNSSAKTRRKAPRDRRLAVERLEERCMLATVTWDGGGNSDWNNAANWDTNNVPVAEDNVVIDLDGTFAVSLSSNVTITELTLGGASGTQTLSVGSNLTLTINGPATISPHGFLAITESSTINGTGTLANQGTVESRKGGRIDLAYENATADSVLRFGHDSNFDFAVLQFGQGFTNHGLIESTSFQGQTRMSIIIGSGSGTLVNAPDGRIHVVPGAVGGERRFILTLDNQGTLILDHPMELVSGRDAAHTNSGSIMVQAGSFTANIAANGSPSFSNTGTIEIGTDRTFLVFGGSFNQQAGLIHGPGTLHLSEVTASFTTDFSNAETTLTTTGGQTIINGPGTLHLVRDATFDQPQSINAPIVNDAVVTLSGGTINGAFTANPGSTLQITSSGRDFGIVFFAHGFTNHGVIEITNLGRLATLGGPAFLNITRFGTETLTNAPDGIIRSLAGSFGGERQINAIIDNQGLIEVLENSLAIGNSGFLGSLTTSGTVRIGEGRSLSANGNLDIATTGLVAADGPASLSVSGLSGAAQDPANLSNLAVTSSGCCTLIEAMSEDRGRTPAGFDSNFALRQLTTGVAVQLVDNADNSPGSAPEAVYAQTVLVRPFAPLDLNGLHLYARSVTIGDFTSISNGTIEIINDGGPLLLNQLQPGDIGSVGERDEWTLFGRAGQSVTVVAKTGGIGPESPVAPPLGFAQIELTDAAQTLLGSASNTTQGDDAVLLNVELPADGVYRVFVSAPPDHAAAKDNYQIGVFDTTADEARIVFNQPYLGQIEHRFAVDRWTFAGVAGLNIRLDVLDRANTSLQFALRGPSGSIFESVTADTIATLPVNGAFELLVGGTEPGSYRFQIDDASPTELVLGTPFAGTLTAGGHAQLFRLPIADTQALSIALDAASTAGHNELYAKIGSPPTRSDYQFASFAPGAVVQQFVIPAAAPGNWFILVYGEAVPQPTSFTLTARGADIILNSLTPNSLPRTLIVDECDQPAGVELVIEGTGFRDVTAVEFVASTGFVRGTAVIDVESPGRIRAGVVGQLRSEFPTNDPDKDFFDFFPSSINNDSTLSVRVRNRDGSEGLLENAIELGAPESLNAFVVAGDEAVCETVGESERGALTLRTNLILPSGFRPFGVQTLTIEYENTGLLPMPSPILVLRLENDDPYLKPIMTLDASIVPEGFLTSANPDGFSDTIQFLASGHTPAVIQPGERMQVPVYLVGFSGDIPFHEPLRFVLDVVRQDNDGFIDWLSFRDSLRPSTIDPEAWDAIFANYVADIGFTSGEYVRELNADARYFGRLGENVTDVGVLFGFELTQADGLHAIQVLASTTDAGAPAPGFDLSIGRAFPNAISSRYRRGALGRGWFHSWETSLAVEPDGTVAISLPGGGQRTFQPDRRPFRQTSYFAAPGDHGSFTRLADDSFDVREASGSLEHYRSDGKLAFIEDLNGNRITATYSGDLLTRLEHSSGQFLDLAYNPAGLIETIADSDSRVVQYSYDPAGEHLVSFADFDGRITRYNYDDGDDIQQKHALTSIESPRGVTRHYAYDDRGRLTSTLLNDGAERIDYTFGSAGEVTATDPAGAASTVFFNQVGLPARFDDPLGNTTTIGFDAEFKLARLTDPAEQAYSFSYDTRGNIIRAADPLGHNTSFGHGAFNRLTSFIDANGHLTQFTYDGNGNHASTIDAIGNTTLIAHDSLGNTTSLTNRRGQVIAYDYNADGKLMRKSYADGTTVDFAYDSRGQLISATDERGVTSFAYDSGDRLTKATYPGGRFIEYSYDSAGRRIQMSNQDGFQVRYAFDSLGRLENMRDDSGILIARYAYDAVGRLARKDLGNGTFTTYEYDAAGRLPHLVNHAPSGSANSQFDYAYDSLGRRTSMAMLDGTWTYEYDAIGQLTHAMLDSTNPAIPDQDLTYEYDAMGNRVRTTENGVVTNYSTNALNQYAQVGPATDAYDADGNLVSTSDGASTTTYLYDEDCRLTGVTTSSDSWSYDYDPLNHRVAVVHNGERTEYLIDPTGFVNVLGEYDVNGNLVAHYTHGLGLTSRVDSSNNAAFYDFDAIGSTAGISGPDGSYVNRYSYSPFGESLAASEGIENPFTYVGQLGVMQESNGLYFMRARYYAPSDGRFVRPDPIAIRGGFNLYRYAFNHPVAVIDPNGLQGFNSGNVSAGDLAAMESEAWDTSVSDTQVNATESTTEEDPVVETESDDDDTDPGQGGDPGENLDTEAESEGATEGDPWPISLATSSIGTHSSSPRSRSAISSSPSRPVASSSTRSWT